jgi:hypothetical protein
MPGRILVVANETAPGTDLHRAVSRLAGGEPAEVLVVAPALNGWVSTWANDIIGARAAAQERLDIVVAALEDDGLEAKGEVGDGNPLVAIEDALRVFPADAIVVSTHPPGRSRWLARSLISKVQKKFELPVTHVVVDLDAGRVELVEPATVAEER